MALIHEAMFSFDVRNDIQFALSFHKSIFSDSKVAFFSVGWFGNLSSMGKRWNVVTGAQEIKNGKFTLDLDTNSTDSSIEITGSLDTSSSYTTKNKERLF